jgi:DNA-binding transcriptional ArsR family regulator
MSLEAPSRDTAVRTLRGSAPVFAALGDETRLSLVATLSAGTPRSIAQLTQGCQVTRQAITKHLRVLEEAGVVRGVRQGRENLFELAPAALVGARQALELISQQWDEALQRLKTFVER